MDGAAMAGDAKFRATHRMEFWRFIQCFVSRMLQLSMLSDLARTVCVVELG